MHILFVLLFLSVWLFILWLGAVALESTGMERSRARFHALSALSGTGFTTSHAESIVEHPVRRRIAATLIFIGNAGIFSFLIALIIFIRDGITMPELYLIIIAVLVLLFMVLAFLLGLVDKITNGVLRLTGAGQQKSLLRIRKVFYETDDYALVHLMLGTKAASKEITLKDIDLIKYGINLIALEHKGEANRHPRPEERLIPGDFLLCYGKQDTINGMIKAAKGE